MTIGFGLYAITDRRVGDLLPFVLASRAGSLAVQLRDKDLPPKERRDAAELLRERTAAAGALLFIGGGDVTLARSVGADGVHLPATFAPTRHAGLLVGCSCHDAAELASAADAGVDFVTLSPVLSSPGKGPALGWTRLAELARSFPLPLFALGGVGPADLETARRHGATGVAGIRGFVG